MDPLVALAPYVKELSTGALVAIFFIAMLRGWLVTSIQVERLISSYKSQTEDWRAAHAASEESRRIQARQIDDLTSELARTTNAIMQALPINERRAAS